MFLSSKQNIFKELIKIQHNIATSIWATGASKQINKNNELTTIAIDSKTKIATLTMNRLPANALNIPLMNSIENAVGELEEQKVNGLILTSASDRIFSAGLDLVQVYGAQREHLVKTTIALQNMLRALFATPIPTVALINGHALAGGCVLAIACDYRIMLPKFTIGLNETRAGIAPPSFAIDSYLNTINSRRIAEADLIDGKCYKSEDALNVGLVDDVVDTREEAFEKCLKFLRSYEGPTKFAKAQTKLNFRENILSSFEKNRQKDLNSFVANLESQDVQEFLGNYLKSLKNKTVKKTA